MQSVSQKCFTLNLKLQLNQCQIVTMFEHILRMLCALAVLKPASARAETYGITLDKTKAAVEKFGSSATINMGAVAAVSVTTGAAILGVSKALEKLGVNDKVVKTLQGIGSALMVAGTLLPIIAKGAQALGVSFTTAGVQIAKAGALASLAWGWVALIVAAVARLLLELSLYIRQLRRKVREPHEGCQEATDRAKKAAEDAKRPTMNYFLTLEIIMNLQNTLDSLVEGTEDWRDTLGEVNDQVLELLQTYPELARYLTCFRWTSKNRRRWFEKT